MTIEEQVNERNERLMKRCRALEVKGDILGALTLSTLCAAMPLQPTEMIASCFKIEELPLKKPVDTA